MFYLMYVALCYVLMRLDKTFSKLGEKVLRLVDAENKVRRQSVSALHKGQKARRACQDLAESINGIGDKMLLASKAKEAELLRRANAMDLERKGVIHMQNHLATVRNHLVDSRNVARLASPLAIRIGNLKRNLKLWSK